MPTEAFSKYFCLYTFFQTSSIIPYMSARECPAGRGVRGIIGADTNQDTALSESQIKFVKSGIWDKLKISSLMSTAVARWLDNNRATYRAGNCTDNNKGMDKINWNIKEILWYFDMKSVPLGWLFIWLFILLQPFLSNTSWIGQRARVDVRWMRVMRYYGQTSFTLLAF